MKDCSGWIEDEVKDPRSQGHELECSCPDDDDNDGSGDNGTKANIPQWFLCAKCGAKGWGLYP